MSGMAKMLISKLKLRSKHAGPMGGRLGAGFPDTGRLPGGVGLEGGKEVRTQTDGLSL